VGGEVRDRVGGRSSWRRVIRAEEEEVVGWGGRGIEGDQRRRRRERSSRK